MLPLPQLLSSRRIGLAQRILLHGPARLHGLIQSTDDGSTGWTRTLRNDLAWPDSFEPGAPSTFPDLVQSLLTTSRNALEARLKRAKTAAVLHQASQDDLTSLETFQQEAYGSIGIPIGLQDPQHFSHAKHVTSLLPTNRHFGPTSKKFSQSYPLPTYI